MYESIKEWVLWFLRVPPEPLDPMGDVRSLRVFRASYNYYRYRFYVWLIRQTIGIVTAMIVLVSIGVAVVKGAGGLVGALVVCLELLFLLGVPFQVIFSYIMLRLDYEMRWYKITDRSLRIREGVMNVHEMTMTFANIQNISITQGPIQRMFKISDVKVETAGGGGQMAARQQGQQLGLNLHLGYFRGVDNAEEVRDLMMKRLRDLRDSGLGHEEEMKSAAEGGEAVGAPGRVSGEMIDVLGALREEARAFRRAAQTLGGSAAPGTS